MAALCALAARHNLAIVEDCCQAHLATSPDGRSGSFGVAGAFSFYPTKNLGALGDGGAIVTATRRSPRAIRRLRNGGQADRYQHQEPGVNSRLDEMQAAVLRARLPFLSGWTGRTARARRSLSTASRASDCGRRACRARRRPRLPSVRRALLRPTGRCAPVAPRDGRHRDARPLSAGHHAPAGNGGVGAGRVPGGGPRLRASVIAPLHPLLTHESPEARRRSRSDWSRYARPDHRRGRIHRLAPVRGSARRAATRCFVLDNLSTGSIDNIAHLKGRRGLRLHDRLRQQRAAARRARRSRRRRRFTSLPRSGVKLIVEQPVHTIETNVHGTEVVLKHASKKKKARRHRVDVGGVRKERRTSRSARTPTSCSAPPRSTAGHTRAARRSTSSWRSRTGRSGSCRSSSCGSSTPSARGRPGDTAW